MRKALIQPFFADLKTFLLDTLFPITCLRCGAEGRFVCGLCLSELAKLDKQYCIACQKPSLGGFTHPRCIAPRGADGLISILNYHDDSVATIIVNGKYHFLPGVFGELGKLLAHQLSAHYPLLTTRFILVPLPLHKRRLRWRGFNQAEILCRAIGKELTLPVMDALVRTKATKTQKDLKRGQRIKNIRDAFDINPAIKSQIKNLNFLLVDDVITTGSTVLEAAKVLKKNGARSVWCLTIARD